MKTLRLLPLILGVAGLAHADTIVGSGHVVSETRAVSGFHEIKLVGTGDVIVTQGDKDGLVVEAEDNILPLIETTVSEGELRLAMKNRAGSIQTSKGIVYRLAVKNLTAVEVTGSGSVRAESLTSDEPRFDVPGSGEIAVNGLKAGSVAIDLAGSGKVKLSGEAHHQTVEIDGSGNYEAKDLKTETAFVALHGSGNARVCASATLEASVSGSGEVGYAGHPKVTRIIEGSGTVRALDAKGD